MAMANPDPEIMYEDAVDVRKDLIMATGRSDYPNQVNNVLGFPFIFRGALDVRATEINEEMKKAAVYAIAELAKEDVPEVVNSAYHQRHLTFGRDYIIPKPLDPRLITKVAPAVAKAAMDSGVALEPITNWNKYRETLLARVGSDNKLIRKIHSQAKRLRKKVVYADAEHYNVLRAAQIAMQDGYAEPIFVGNESKIREIIEKYQLNDIADKQIIDPKNSKEKWRRERNAEYLFEKRKRKGLSKYEAGKKMYDRNYFGAMMVEHGEADAFIAGYATKYADALVPLKEVISCDEKCVGHLAGMYIMQTKFGNYFLADTTVNIHPSVETLVKTTLLTYETIRGMGIEPVIAMIAYSNFGTTRNGSPDRVREAVEILHNEHPEIVVDGEMQMNFALNTSLRQKKFPFSKLKGKKVNTLIFPNLSSGNIAYKMMQEIGNAEVLGPILMGMRRPVNIVQLEASIREIVDLTAVAVVDAQTP
jgi:malate dehydrogenase (oxaloacetate-decarboxylating)(NADP+)